MRVASDTARGKGDTPDPSLDSVDSAPSTSVHAVEIARMSAATPTNSDRTVVLAVIVAALGYLVDIYDLILFSVVRKPSLEALGVPAAEILDVGVRLINFQMIGMLVGGVVWGALVDS